MALFYSMRNLNKTRNNSESEGEETVCRWRQRRAITTARLAFENLRSVVEEVIMQCDGSREVLEAKGGLEIC